jgi:hypothetical protein
MVLPLDGYRSPDCSLPCDFPLGRFAMAASTTRNRLLSLLFFWFGIARRLDGWAEQSWGIRIASGCREPGRYLTLHEAHEAHGAEAETHIIRCLWLPLEFRPAQLFNIDLRMNMNYPDSGTWLTV